jgi:hypothetical protein
MGALHDSNVWITNKVDMLFKDLSPRDWLDTKCSAVQIATTHALLLSLTKDGQVYMFALAANPNPQNNILM